MRRAQERTKDNDIMVLIPCAMLAALKDVYGAAGTTKYSRQRQPLRAFQATVMSNVQPS